MKPKQYLYILFAISFIFLAGVFFPYKKKYTHTLIVERDADRELWCKEIANVDTSVIGIYAKANETKQSTGSIDGLLGLLERRIELLKKLGYN